MTLGFSIYFPDGRPTFFPEKILQPYRKGIRMPPDFIPKIHTFRLGNRWRAGMRMHLVTGNRTKNREQFGVDIPELQHCNGVQPCMIWHDNLRINIAIGPADTPEGRILTRPETNLFAANDGFNSVDEMTRWFFPKGYDPTAAPLVGQIVHFSNFRY